MVMEPAVFALRVSAIENEYGPAVNRHGRYPLQNF
jgi:hypothetical protein